MAIRRSRTKAEARLKNGITITHNDIRGPIEAVTRYVELDSHRLVQFDNRYDDDARRRLGRIAFHEVEKWSLKQKPIVRVNTYDENSIGTAARYKEGPAAHQYLINAALMNEQQSRYARATKVGGTYPSRHNLLLAAAVADIELACTKAGLRFINHLDILLHASPEAQRADDPLLIPLPQIAHTNKNGRQVVTDTALRPDALFAIEYPEGRRFFFFEYDMGNENTTTRDLNQSSWPRKIVSYHAAREAVRKHLNIKNFYILVNHPEHRRHGDIAEAITRIVGSSELFCLQSFSDFPRYGNLPKITDRLFTADWQRVGHEPINLQRV